jgi:phenylpyruvate tautomerase
MPICQVFTNVEAKGRDEQLLPQLSKLLAERFGKPDRWVMTCLVPAVRMTFGGTTEPTAFVVVRNIGTMKPADTAALSRGICERLEAALSVPRDRVYVEFGDAKDYLWGWNAETFA